MKELFLIRGVPGAGKTTLTKSLNVDVRFSADMYHVNGNGVYDWKPQNVKLSHEWCQSQVITAMQEGRSIAVDNTFTTFRELGPYFELAKRFEYRVTTLIVENRHGNKSIHNVPEETIEKMKARFDIVL